MHGVPLVYTGLHDPNRILLEPTLSPMYINNTVYLPIRTFYLTSSWKGQESSSKIEETVKNIKEEKELKQKIVDGIVQDMEPSKKAVAKVTIWQKVKGEVLHYYHGFRLLGLDMKVSAKLIWRILHGKELSRREHNLVKLHSNCYLNIYYINVYYISNKTC